MEVLAIPLNQLPERYSLALAALKAQTIAATTSAHQRNGFSSALLTELTEAKRLIGLYKTECDEIMQKLLSRGNENFLLSEMTEADLIILLGL